jgi:hypothetical protein
VKQDFVKILRGGGEAEALKKQTISRQDAEAQRLAKNNGFVLFASSATLRESFCSSRDSRTPSVP